MRFGHAAYDRGNQHTESMSSSLSMPVDQCGMKSIVIYFVEMEAIEKDNHCNTNKHETLKVS